MDGQTFICLHVARQKAIGLYVRLACCAGWSFRSGEMFTLTAIHASIASATLVRFRQWKARTLLTFLLTYKYSLLLFIDKW